MTYLKVSPGGGVSLRAMGDMGHLCMDETSFSGHHGINW
jgi:hypothetical protein